AVVHTSDGRVLDQAFEADTLIVYPGERFNVLAEVLDTSAASVWVDYLDPYRLKFLAREYIPLNDADFEYIDPVIVENDADTIGYGMHENQGAQALVYPNPAKDQVFIQSF